MKMLLDLAPNEMVRKHLQEWNVLGGVPDEMFQLRTGVKTHWGPYGHLVRELHFHTSENGQHDYLRLPELVEDVCKAYFENYAHDLTPHYLKVLHPCIIRQILFMKRVRLKRHLHMLIHQSGISRRMGTQLSV